MKFLRGLKGILKLCVVHIGYEGILRGYFELGWELGLESLGMDIREREREREREESAKRNR